jgi:sortase A
MRWRALLSPLALVFLLGGGATLAHPVYMRVKGVLAGVLIERALEAHMRDGKDHLPWDWADIHPIARLEVDRLGVRVSILTGATGATLAFGAGHVDGTALPGRPGHSVLAGHRDRSFAFLRDLKPGDVLRIRAHAGTTLYVVDGSAVVPETDTRVLDPSPGAVDGARLSLLTCYPFGGLLRSPWRYVVSATALTPRPHRGTLPPHSA